MSFRAQVDGTLRFAMLLIIRKSNLFVIIILVLLLGAIGLNKTV
nr:MAG TPA: hypothetical protein [Bacteriophage sp.]